MIATSIPPVEVNGLLDRPTDRVLADRTIRDLIVRKMDQARLLLAAAKDATGAKQVADAAKAAETYARRQHLADEIIEHAHAVLSTP